MEKPPKEKKETRKAIVFDKEVDAVYGVRVPLSHTAFVTILTQSIAASHSQGVSGQVTLVNKAVPAETTTIRNVKGKSASPSSCKFTMQCDCS